MIRSRGSVPIAENISAYLATRSACFLLVAFSIFRYSQKHGRDVNSSDSLGPGAPAKYTLTRIYSVEYTKGMESVFEIIAEPNRRAILSLLVSSQQSVGEIERQLRMTQPTVSKHLRVLREAGFVESTVDAQRRFYRVKPEPLQEVDAWLAPFRRFWSAHVDALERHLDRMGSLTPSRAAPTKRKTRRRRRGANRERDKGETK
jgi:DNA-binding transcriptional ArsR family regulator